MSTETLNSQPDSKPAAGSTVTSADPDPALNPALDALNRRRFLARAGALTATAATMLSSDVDAAKPRHALDDPHLNREPITYPAKDGAAIKAFLATPKSDHKRAGVLVIHEIFGLNDHIRDVACRLAQAGYTALAPDLFSREGTPPPLTGGFGPVMQFVSAIPDSQLMSDLESAMAFLRARPDSNGKVGVVGFCWGGRVSMLLDGNAPDLNAAVAYYGRISGDTSPNQPANPIDLVSKMKAPLLGHFGAEDTGIPPSEAAKLRDALREHQTPFEIDVYEGAGHAFNNDTRESYRPEAAKLAWKRTLDWFARYLH
jgi:carboxymethylenebutenolidase